MPVYPYLKLMPYRPGFYSYQGLLMTRPFPCEPGWDKTDLPATSLTTPYTDGIAFRLQTGENWLIPAYAPIYAVMKWKRTLNPDSCVIDKVRCKLQSETTPGSGTFDPPFIQGETTIASPVDGRTFILVGSLGADKSLERKDLQVTFEVDYYTTVTGQYVQVAVYHKAEADDSYLLLPVVI